MVTKPKPTVEEAEQAIDILERAIREDSSNARAPWEGSTPDDTPIWTPCRWTLRYAPVKKGEVGWIWGMDTSDQQVVAYSWIRAGQSTTYVTHNGHERHNANKALPLHPSAMMRDWYPREIKFKRETAPASAGGK